MILNIFTPNTEGIRSFVEKAKYIMIWRISVAFTIMFSILAPINFRNNIVFSAFSILFILCLCSLFYLKLKKKSNLLYWAFSIFGTLTVLFTLNNVNSYTHFVDFLWIMFIILLTFIGLGKRAGIFITVTNVLGIIYFYYFVLNTHILTIQPLSNVKIGIAVIEVVLSLSCVTFLINQFVKFNTFYANELQNSNEQLLKKNNENTFLVKEIHHRVKNNLQIIISLLRLQRGELKTDEAKRHFNEAINRILVMSLIHKKLYQKNDMAQIEIQPYINDLSKDVIHTSNIGHPIAFEVNSEINKVGLKTIVPLGLLINELLSNSIKHAFKKDGNISISILKSKEIDELFLIYKDDGKWNESKEKTKSFGLGLIQTLTEQLEGSYQREQSTYTFKIKNLDD